MYLLLLSKCKQNDCKFEINYSHSQSFILVTRMLGSPTQDAIFKSIEDLKHLKTLFLLPTAIYEIQPEANENSEFSYIRAF